MLVLTINDPAGYTEAWLVDHVAINVVEDGMRLSIGSNGIHQIEEFAELYPRENNYLDRDKLVEISKLKRVDRENYKINNFRPNITSFIRNNVEPVTIRNNRNCSDPENQSEVNIVLTEGGWPEEITWFLLDSLTGATVLSGLAPYDTTFVSQMGTIFFKVLIHMVMVGMMR